MLVLIFKILKKENIDVLMYLFGPMYTEILATTTTLNIFAIQMDHLE